MITQILLHWQSRYLQFIIYSRMIPATSINSFKSRSDKFWHNQDMTD